MIDHEYVKISSCELMPLSQTDGLIVWLDLHITQITTSFSVDSSFDVAGYDTETEVEIEVDEVWNDEEGLTELTEKQITERTWWKELKQKAEDYAQEY